MTTLHTERLVLLPLSRQMIERRLEQEDFTLGCQIGCEVLDVHFGPEWPGVPLGAFPFFLTQLNGQDVLEGSFAAVDPRTGEVVGMLGSKGPLDANGMQEIGYGFNPSFWGNGYATEATSALVAHLLSQPGVRTVTAQTALTNRASERVLEKSGFVRTGHSHSERDGDLTVWTYKSV